MPKSIDVLRSPAQQRALMLDDTYRIGKYRISCNLPTGQPVRVTLAEDASDYQFIAVKGAYGPTILANEWRIRDASPEVGVFHFYRECAVHLLTNVKATRPEDAVYPEGIIKASDCLAFFQTVETVGPSASDDLERRVRDGMQREYGSRYPISRDALRQCRDSKHAAQVAEKARGR